MADVLFAHPLDRIVNVSWAGEQPIAHGTVGSFPGSLEDQLPDAVFRAYNPDGSLLVAETGELNIITGAAVGPTGLLAYGGITPNAVIGDTIITYGGTRIYVLDKTGARRWMKQLIPLGQGYGANVVCAFDGDGNLVVGNATPVTPGSPIIKYDPNGNVVWQNNTASVLYHHVACDPWGNAAAVASANDPAFSTLIVFGPAGNIRWNKPFAGFNPYFRCAFDGDGNLWTIGTTGTIIKHNPSGNVMLEIPTIGGGSGRVDIDIDSRGHAWTLQNNDSSALLQEYDPDGVPGLSLALDDFFYAVSAQGSGFAVYRAQTIQHDEAPNTYLHHVFRYDRQGVLLWQYVYSQNGVGVAHRYNPKKPPETAP